MPWPTDPERRAIALENFRAAQRARWARNDGEREKFRDRGLAQWSSDEARGRMSEIKREQYEKRPEIRLRIKAARAHQGGISPRHREAIELGRQRARRRKATRLLLLKQRAMLVLRNGSSPKP